jgi:hypothetical protein
MGFFLDQTPPVTVKAVNATAPWRILAIHECTPAINGAAKVVGIWMKGCMDVSTVLKAWGMLWTKWNDGPNPNRIELSNMRNRVDKTIPKKALQERAATSKIGINIARCGLYVRSLRITPPMKGKRSIQGNPSPRIPADKNPFWPWLKFWNVPGNARISQRVAG